MDPRGLKPTDTPGKPRVSIALCTCNGERFVEALLASLARQTFPPKELVIGDDASDDGTLAILENFARSAPFPVRVVPRSKRLGHTENFLAIARVCTGEWIAFADQDDVWFDTKLAGAHAAIAAHPGVLLVNQRALLCDEELRPRSNVLFPEDSHPRLHRAPHRRLPLVWPGFLMTVQARLLHDYDPELRPALADGTRIGHGRWSFLLAAALGSYFVTDVPSAWYRRHAAALTGDYRPVRQDAADFRARNLAALTDDRDYAKAAAECLKRLADLAVKAADGLRLAAAAGDYAHAAQVLGARAGCYSAPTLPKRLASLLAAGRNGAYFGAPLYAGGAKAVVKDTAAVLGL